MINYYPFDNSNIKTTGLDILVSTPGKVILHGEHSVVYGKLALAASVDLRTKFNISEIDVHNTFLIQCHSIKTAYKYDVQKINDLLLNEPLPLLEDKREYNLESSHLLDHEALTKRVENFLKVTQHNFSMPNQDISFKAFFYLLAGILGSTNVSLTPLLSDCTTELNSGAGLGSSASYSVSISAALLQYVKSKTRGNNLSKECYKPCIWEINLKEFNERELKIINQWAFNVERIIHGTPSGLDNTICTYGSMVEFRKGSVPKKIKTSCSLNFLLVNSNVPRETKKLVAKVGVYKSKYPEILDHMLDSMDAISKKVLEIIMQLNKLSASDDSTKIYDSLAELYSMNHNLLNTIGVGHKKLDKIVEILAEHGLSGKLTGGGGGGYAICLIPPNFDSTLLRQTINTLTANGFDVIQTSLGGCGVRVENVF